MSLALGACSSAPLKAPRDYPQLKLKTDEANTLVFVKPGLHLGPYKKAYIAPVVIQIGTESGARDVTDEEANTLAGYAGQRLKERLAGYMTLVDEPGEDVLSIRFRILDLTPTSKAQIAMLVPPFAMVNMLAPKGAFLGSITLAGELYEGHATEPCVAFVATRSRPGRDVSVAFSRWAVAEKVIDNAAEGLTSDLENDRKAGR